MATLKPGAWKEMAVKIQAIEKENRRERADYTEPIGHSSCFGLYSEDHLSTVFNKKHGVP